MVNTTVQGIAVSHRVEVQSCLDTEFHRELNFELANLIQITAQTDVPVHVMEVVIVASITTYKNRVKQEVRFEYVLNGDEFLAVLGASYTQTVNELHDTLFTKIASHYQQPQLLTLRRVPSLSWCSV